MEIEITKIKVRDGMFATIEYDELYASVKDEVTKVCNNPMHEDLKNRIQDLAVHAVLIDELVDVTKVKGHLENYQPAILPFITVTGVTIGGADEGVVISFTRKLSTGRVINLNTPFTKFNDDQIKYKFDDDLQLAIQALREEAEAYVKGEKFGEGTQLVMDMPGGSEDEEAPL